MNMESKVCVLAMCFNVKSVEIISEKVSFKIFCCCIIMQLLEMCDKNSLHYLLYCFSSLLITEIFQFLELLDLE